MPYELSFTKKFEVAPERAGWGPHKFYINECCWGGDVVSEQLLPLVKDHEKVFTCQEDWGWFIWFRKDDQRFEINVMCDCPEFGDFRIHLVAFRRKWLRKVVIDTPELEEIREVVTKELRAWAGEVKTTPMDDHFMPRD